MPVATTSPAAAAPRRRAADVAYDAIESLISTLQLEPGSQIVEAEIAERTGMGRTPVREALLRMSSIGLIVQQPRRGLLVSGRIWQTLDAKDKALITDLVKQSLDAQIKDIVTTELGLIDKFKATSLVIKNDTAFNPAPLIAEFDKIWLPKAPAIAELRKIGATL